MPLGGYRDEIYSKQYRPLDSTRFWKIDVDFEAKA